MDFATLEDTQSFKSCRKDNNTLEFIEEDEVDNMSVTSLDSDGESEMVVNAKDNVKSSKLIQKPPGEPGRPGSGGWRLDAASLGWTKEMFDTLIVSAIIFLKDIYSCRSLSGYGAHKDKEIP
jgi:hypothetical protein